MQRATIAVVGMVAATAALAACSSSGTTAGNSSSPSGTLSSAAPASSTSPSASGGALSGSITVDAASSLTGAFTTIASQFEAAHPGTHITFSFASSGDLSTQITQGAKVDVFASASPGDMNTVVSGGDAQNPVDFVANKMEIAVPPSNPGKITTLTDLAKSGVKVATCVVTAPCGEVAAQVFKNAKITVKSVDNPPDVKTTLAAVESGEVDAGMVYVTDVLSAGSKVKGVTIPAADNASTTYPIARLTHALNPNLAQAFVDYVISSAGQKVLLADGFEKA